MRIWLRSLASLSGLRIRRGRKLRCMSQMRLRSRVAVAVAQAGSYSSNWTPSLGTSICHRSSPRNGKKTKKKEKRKKNWSSLAIYKAFIVEELNFQCKLLWFFLHPLVNTYSESVMGRTHNPCAFINGLAAFSN